jgi:hypothetical protein
VLHNRKIVTKTYSLKRIFIGSCVQKFNAKKVRELGKFQKRQVLDIYKNFCEKKYFFLREKKIANDVIICNQMIYKSGPR